MKTLLAQGAESRLYREKDNVVKDRFPKAYRLKQIDDPLRKARTRREAKILEKLASIGFPAPRISSTDSERFISMDYLNGELLKNAIEKKDYKKLSKEIGKKIAVLHNNGIIHGDLTTSNMIFKDGIYFIDFGLSFFSEKNEDKAVDLHLLRQALESKHYKIWEKSFSETLKAYKKNAKNGIEIIKRLETVEKRGRNRQK